MFSWNSKYVQSAGSSGRYVSQCMLSVHHMAGSSVPSGARAAPPEKMERRERSWARWASLRTREARSAAGNGAADGRAWWRMRKTVSGVIGVGVGALAMWMVERRRGLRSEALLPVIWEFLGAFSRSFTSSIFFFPFPLFGYFFFWRGYQRSSYMENR
ncbi:hypothetical protein MPH_05402 [Macrophomina phaseolina MS6]|uniref:Uncharacterized protein n=1 Tax=Macrophomina phaseolina (strain MS6) TaxID=1126212 RepID=K2R4M1_MACPH|nr:hypothetical protein MPH_05402 [Macrophomina phaseolina MS6]